jgi:hypothetical protein
LILWSTRSRTRLSNTALTVFRAERGAIHSILSKRLEAIKGASALPPNEYFLGKLTRELWASEKNELRDAAAGAFWAAFCGLASWADDAQCWPQQVRLSGNALIRRRGIVKASDLANGGFSWLLGVRHKHEK